MSLSTSISVAQGGTGVTVTGGTAKTFVNDGTGIAGKKVLVDSSNTNPQTRSKLVSQVTVGATSSNGGTAKLHRTQQTIHQPYVDANGVVYPLADSLSMSYHPAMTAAERETKFWNTIFLVVDAELANTRNLIND